MTSERARELLEIGQTHPHFGAWNHPRGLSYYEEAALRRLWQTLPDRQTKTLADVLRQIAEPPAPPPPRGKIDIHGEWLKMEAWLAEQDEKDRQERQRRRRSRRGTRRNPGVVQRPYRTDFQDALQAMRQSFLTPEERRQRYSQPRRRRSPTPPPSPNPAEVSPEMERLYTRFHGVEPDRAQQKSGWVPGVMSVVGTGVDIGYKVADRRSSKGTRVPYVHDFDSGVTVYKRGGSGRTRSWSHFPDELMVLGSNIGFSYRDGRGVLHEVKGSSSKKLAVTPNGRTLVVLDGKGVLYLIEGGSMYVDDWIRN